MGRRAWPALALLVLALLPSGCWDKMEVEDQLFAVTMAVDPGERSRFKVTARIPVSAQMRSGILGGRNSPGRPVEIVSGEGDTISQATLVMNTSMSRRITLRHLRGVIVSDRLPEPALNDVLDELQRNGEIHATAGFWLARGSGGEILRYSRPTGEFNPGRVSEGLLLVEKGLHMAPHVRLHQVFSRRSELGVDAIAPIIALNRALMGREEPARAESAVAGDLDREGQNPMEVAGTALFRGMELAGFVNVDETQALLALRGEMGKAYMSFPDPTRGGETLFLRFQQENKPKIVTALTPAGPRVTVRLLFEGEVLSGRADYSDPAVTRKVEEAASRLMMQRLQSVVSKMLQWRADPVGFGLRFRGRFATWQEWERYNWPSHLDALKVQVTAEMRLRRFGLLHRGPYQLRRE